MAAGCIAGGIEATAVWPMEFIKTQLQLQSKSKGAALPYNGMISGLTYYVRTTGFLSLYRGLAPTLIGSIPKAGIRFGLNAIIKDNLRDSEGKLTPGKNFLAGLGAGVSEALIIVAPVETVKTKCIELNMPFLNGFKQILANEGVSGIYQGAAATALKQGSNQGLRFMWFNEYKKRVTNDGETQMTPLLGLLGGMSAGCFSTMGNNVSQFLHELLTSFFFSFSSQHLLLHLGHHLQPFDVVKVRIINALFPTDLAIPILMCFYFCV